MANRTVIQLPCNESDGDAKYWPAGDYEYQPGDRLYHDKLADMWMKESSKQSSSKSYSLANNHRDFLFEILIS